MTEVTTTTKPTTSRIPEYEHSELECLAIKHIPARVLSEEARLFGTKWFDYRHLHPTHATYIFVDEFNQAYGRVGKKVVDVKMAYAKAISGGDFLNQKGGAGHREKLSLWKLRMIADEHGIPYDIFSRSVLRYFVERCGWSHLPRPAHILKTVEAHLFALDYWTNLKRSQLYVAKSPYYQIEEFRGEKYQLEHEAHVVANIRLSDNKASALAAAIYRLKVLRIEEAIRQFPESVVERAIEYCNNDKSVMTLY